MNRKSLALAALLVGLSFALAGCSGASGRPSSFGSPSESTQARLRLVSVLVRKHVSSNGAVTRYDWEAAVENRGTVSGRAKVSVCSPASGCYQDLGESAWFTVEAGATQSVTGGVPTNLVNYYRDHDDAEVSLWEDRGAQGSALVERQQVLVTEVR